MKKMRFLKVLLVMVMLAAFSIGAAEPVSGYEENGTYTFHTEMFNEVSTSEEQWFASEDNRALLTIAMALEIGDYISYVYEGEFDPILALFEASFVGKYGNVLCVALTDGEDDMFIVTCCPQTGEINISYLPYLGEEITLESMEVACEDGVYENDLDLLVNMLMSLFEE